MKKLLALILTAIMVISLCSCGGGSKPADQAAPAAEAAAASQEVKTEAEPAAETETPAETAEAEPAAEQPAEAETPADPAEALPEEEPTQAEEIAEQFADTVVNLPYEGDYTLFAVRDGKYTVSAEEKGVNNSSITLAEGGTGSMTIGEESMDITTWSVEDGVITITMADESTADGQIRGGVIELDIFGTGDLILIYSQEAADISGYELLTLEEVNELIAAEEESSKTRLGLFLDTLDMEEGIHLKYQLKVDYMDAVQEYDVHAKGGTYYSSRTTKVSGYENTTVTFIRDGKVYNLSPDDKTGKYITDLPLSYTNANLMLMDSLYSELTMATTRTGRTEEERELEGTTYSVDVYPETEYQSETIVYFDGDDQPVFCSKAAPVIETAVDIGESFYTVEVIDDQVDESLFDVSAYNISE